MRGVGLVALGQVDAVDLPVPDPGPGQVLLRVEACGLCGSDLHLVEIGALPPRSVLGHEVCGTVVAAGPGTDAVLGQRRAVWPLLACRSCPACQAGMPHRCASPRRIGIGGSPGGFAEYLLADAETSLPVADGVDDVTAALTEPLAVGLHAVRLSRLRPGDRCLVVGAGCIGLMVLQCALLAGAVEVSVVERAPQRRAAAQRFGAAQVLTAEEAQAPGAVSPVDVAFECAGARGTLQLCAELTRPRGEVVGVGVATEETLRIPVWLTKELTLRLAYETADVFPLALRLLEEGRLHPAEMVSRRATLEEVVPVVMAELHQRQEVKVMMVGSDRR